ncbi:MAG: 1-deoxy-D-xylulose-5-phosphate reductoisomerase [Eubacteriales bacterium]|nr:1-deoxy-D-xylulose-5-phosphate reductoisomerase [Eubacteriales bacterium]
MRTIAVLGAGGSIGSQTLQVVREHPQEYKVEALTIHSRAETLFALAREFKPKVCGIVREPEQIPQDLRGIEWFFGEDCNERVVEAAKAQDVLTAVVGAAGLPASLAALEHSERLLLANKEALVTGGELVTGLARRNNKPILPVDSEHSAIFQCLRGRDGNRPERLILTASGGPFRTWEKEKMYGAGIADVLRHPTWNMGRKITVDCATMVNKGLEVIEARYLFDMPQERIGVLVHPQSIVHSMVEFEDGCILAQLGVPDMRAPIAYAMSFPQRMPVSGRRLDLAQAAALTFEQPDPERFPALRLAYAALAQGGSAACVFNGANEVAVGAFLNGQIPFGEIVPIVEETMARAPMGNCGSLQAVTEADAQARRIAQVQLAARAK